MKVGESRGSPRFMYPLKLAVTGSDLILNGITMEMLPAVSLRI